MDAKLRIVTRLPLVEVWRDDGFSTSARGAFLTGEDVRKLLQAEPIQFIVANVGSALQWIPMKECFHFWKDEVKPHLANANVLPDEFPGSYCYFASLWKSAEATPIVVLEKHH